jgi:hypothetical protein
MDCLRDVRVASLVCDALPKAVLIKQPGNARSAFDTFVTTTSRSAIGAKLTYVSSAGTSTRPIPCTREMRRGPENGREGYANLLTTTRFGGEIGREGYSKRGPTK